MQNKGIKNKDVISSVSTETSKKTYKETLNLPKTPFSMRANLAQQEPLTQKRWKKQELYHKLQEKNAANPSFIFHDGPPYANGDIHIGHLLNKVLKDFVLRSQLLLGKACPFTPGWDCHGLPIEHKVMTTLQANKDPILNLPTNEQRQAIRKACQNYAKGFIKTQAKQMQSLLTMADYEAPYLTMSKHFESRTLEVFASLVKEGLVYRQLKPVHWSLENQTALAEAELEYHDKEDVAIYLGFQLKNTETLGNSLGLDTTKPIKLAVWTTTPWTLPANLAIAVNKHETYVILDNTTNYVVVAKPLADAFQEKISENKWQIVVDVPGSQLCGLQYQHPFCQREGQVYSADFVTMEDGTGLVHIAPGHGQEDYQLGQKEGLEVYCPVTAKGCFDESVPDWLQGQHIWKANPKIVQYLQDNGHLFKQETFNHSYPHDWRSKTPVIFRSTEQWFISVDKPLKNGGKSLRDMALEAIRSEINFVPDWGQKRLYGMLENRPDWCISRQRSWGLPIPAFQSENGLFMTQASIEAVSKVFAEEGSNAWFEQDSESLLRYYDPSADPDCPKNLKIADLSPSFDIFDVWFESGSSWFSVIEAQGHKREVDLYLEGSDQHRGWFHLSLLTALGAKQKAPYKTLLTHGFIVDKDGKKMSKSGGNALAVAELLKSYGAEVSRWWVGSLKFENDIKVDISFFDTAADHYRKIRNTLRFLLSNLSDFEQNREDPHQQEAFIKQVDPNTLDAWILERCSELQKNCLEAFKTYNFKQAHQMLSLFCQEDLSAIYCMAVKDRLYCDAKVAPRRVHCQNTIWMVFHCLCKLLSVFLPHTADEAFLSLHPDKESIHLSSLVIINKKANPKWARVFAIREEALKKLEEAKTQGIENTLDAGLVLGDPKDELQPFKAELADLFGVSRVTLESKIDSILVQDLREQPRCERSWKRDETVQQDSDGHWLSKRDAEAVAMFLQKVKTT
ncbi:MAG: isoleucine--tRNA ligase [bacterium]